MGLDVGPLLVVAASELKLVRLLRGAMLATNLADGKVGPPAGRFTIEPTPHIEPRTTIEPTPRIEPRRTIELTPRLVASQDCYEPCKRDMVVPGCEGASKPRRELVLAPPWETPVWKMPLQPPQVVKLHIHRVDVHNKGSLIDLFL